MVVATGFFDGVHLGHRLVIEQLVDAAAKRCDQSMVISFWPHPRNVLQQEARSLRLLTTLEEKKALLYSLGVDHVEIVPFTKEFSRMTTMAYLRDVVQGRFGGKAILLGYDNRMGSDSLDSCSVAEVAGSLSLEVIRAGVIPSVVGGAVSSTKIRECISKGDIVSAEAMLGYSYCLKGVVVEGNRVGRSIGFPTANLQLYEPLKLVPGNGVYLVKVRTLGMEYDGMCNIGCRPTLGDGRSRTIETNIFGFDEDIYGLDMELTFIEKIREEVRFPGLGELAAQLAADRSTCLGLLKGRI